MIDGNIDNSVSKWNMYSYERIKSIYCSLLSHHHPRYYITRWFYFCETGKFDMLCHLSSLHYQHTSMPTQRTSRPATHEQISKSRVVNALILTFLTVLIFLILLYHFIWAVQVMMYQPYGNLLNNIVYGPGTLIANAGLSSKLIKYINKKLVEDKIEADYKKYI